MKLTDKQMNILKLLNEGWSLGLSANTRKMNYTWWIQKGELGCGGESVHGIHSNIFKKLREEGLIASDNKHHFPTTPYFLTSKGKEILKEQK